MLVRYDPDVFASIPPPGGWIAVENPSPIRDRPTPGTDCNRNFIDDALDLNGLIARGPYAVGEQPRALAAADLDSDGDADLVVANSAEDNLSILWQRSHRIYEEDASRIEVLDSPYSVTVADFDRDGDPDIAVGHSVSKSVSVLVNDGAGGFRRDDYPISEDPSLSRAPLCVTAADMDDDGYPDLLAGSGEHDITNNKVTLMRNNGDGTSTFGAPQHNFVPLNRPHGLVAIDLDDDGDHDLAVFGQEPDIVILINPGPASVSFEDWADHSLVDIGITYVRAVGVGDLNGDNLPDFVAEGAGDVSVLMSGPGWWPDRWTLSARYPHGDTGSSLVLTDLDGDNDLDVAVAVYNDNALAILINDGDGTFADARFVPLGDGPRAIVTGNFDGDLRPELAIAHRRSNDVWVLHVRPAPVSEDRNDNGIPDSCEIEAD